MPTKQTIQDVAMIARNGIDRVIELERETKRLREALRKANSGMEHFERLWYLRADALERLLEAVDEALSQMPKGADPSRTLLAAAEAARAELETDQSSDRERNATP